MPGVAIYFVAWGKEMSGTWRGNRLSHQNLIFTCPKFLVGSVLFSLFRSLRQQVIASELPESQRSQQTSRDLYRPLRRSALQLSIPSRSHALPGFHNEPAS